MGSWSPTRRTLAPPFTPNRDSSRRGTLERSYRTSMEPLPVWAERLPVPSPIVPRDVPLADFALDRHGPVDVDGAAGDRQVHPAGKAAAAE